MTQPRSLAPLYMIYDPTQFISPPKTPYEALQAQGLYDISHIGTELI